MGHDDAHKATHATGGDDVLSAADVPFTPAGTIAADTVQEAIEEVASEAGGGGAPTTADYLVATAQAGLSAEVVVGATPNGELGGTWGDITVDATHSGSTHAAAQAAAESTAASALSSHAADGTSIHGITDTAALETTTGAQTKVDTHVNDASAAHAASAISFAPDGSIAATNVQAAIVEVRDEAGIGVPYALYNPSVLAGALAWSQDPQVCTGNRTPAAATIYLTKIAVPNSITFTNISVSVITAGNTYTNAQVGLYSSAGTYLASCAVQASAGTNGFGSTGWRTFALDAAQAITGSTTAFVWVGVHFGTNSATACNISTTPASGLLVGSGLLTASTARTGSYTGHATNSLATIGNLTPSSITLVDRVIGILVT